MFNILHSSGCTWLNCDACVHLERVPWLTFDAVETILVRLAFWNIVDAVISIQVHIVGALVAYPVLRP